VEVGFFGRRDAVEAPAPDAPGRRAAPGRAAADRPPGP
jgi:hypothetical protein